MGIPPEMTKDRFSREGVGAGEKEAADGPSTLKEAAKKRNTDCIYFLASPQLCKKGKLCEYRHSDGARVNPRDCWYWLNGNCLNLKCSFRHPPLHDLIGIPGASSLPTPPSQTVATPQILVRHSMASHNPKKQSATCYFFQKGQCLKGDKCAFVHDPKSNEPEITGIPVPRQVTMVSPPVAETSKTIKKESWGLRPCTWQKIPGATKEKLVGSLPLSETMPTSYQSQPADEHFQNDSGADEFLKFARESLQDGRTPYSYSDSSVDEFLKFMRESLQDGKTPFRYSDVATNLGRLMLKGKFDYLRSGREDRYYDREQQRTSSMRYKDGQVISGERVRHKVACPDEIDKSDLRYRLLKQRRLHGPRSVVSSDVRGKPSWKDERDQASCRKDHSSKDQQHPVSKSSTTRLQGRIKFPARNSHDGPVDSQSERQQGRERHRCGSALTRLTLNQEGRSDSLKRKLPVCFDADSRSIRSHPVRRFDPDHLNFPSPKSLAELRGAIVLDTSQEQSNKSISSKLSLEGSSPTPPNNVLNSESLSPPEITELCSNDNENDDAPLKKGLVAEGVVDGQSTVKSLVQMECDVPNAAKDREESENLEINEEEERKNLEQTEDVQWSDEESLSEEDGYDNDDFARKVALLVSGMSYSEIVASL